MPEDRYQPIVEAIVNGEDEEAPRLTQAALEGGAPPLDVLQQGVVAGILKTGELWAANEYFLPDVILAAEAFKAAMKPLEPHLKASKARQYGKKIVIGVVEGDVHDLGKGLVAAMLSSAGFEVIDLGINVAADRFIGAVKEHQPAIVGLGAYMTTTMLQMKGVIAELERLGLRTKVKVMVGGVPTSQEFADEVGADAWGKDALDAMHKALALVGA